MVITNIKSFLQGGGTKTDTGTALKSFQDTITSAGGKLKGSGGGSSYTEPSGGGGGGGTSYVEPTVSPDVQAVRENATIAKAIRTEAQSRGVDISTPVRERGFINVLINEQKLNEEKLKLGNEVFVGGQGYSVPLGMEDAFTKSVMGNVSNVNLIENTPKFDLTSPSYASGTRTDLGEQFKINTPVYSPRTVYQYQTGIAGTSKWGTSIPMMEFQTIGEDWSSRISTPEEITEFKLYTTAITPEIAFGTRRNKIPIDIPILGNINIPAPAPIAEFYGETKGKIQILSQEPISVTKFKNPFENYLTNNFGNIGKSIGGGISGLIPQTKGELITTGALIGIGGLIGAGVEGGSLLLSKVPKIGDVLSTGLKLGAVGGGAYLTGAYVLKTAIAVSLAPDYFAKGEIIGGGLREFGAMGVGYGLGTKGFQALRGWYVTKGRMELPLERLTREEVILGEESFPTAPSKMHLQLFKETAIKLPELTSEIAIPKGFYIKKALGESLIGGETFKPGGFHVTGEQFFGKGKGIIPQPGTAELPGLYVSSEASIHFARLTGSAYTLKLPKLQDFLGGEKPAIAFLKPKGFREVGFKGVSPYKLGEQYFKFKFVNPIKLGYMDIPKMKTEIEAIARPETGIYGFESGKYYTTIKGVRVPIDVFGYTKGEMGIKLPGVKGKGFVSEEYYLPKETSLSDIRSSLLRLGSLYSSKGISSKGYSSYLKSSYLPTSSSLSKASSSMISKLSKTSSYLRRKSSLVSGYSGYSGRGYGGSSMTMPSPSYVPPPPTPKIYWKPEFGMPEMRNIIRGTRWTKNTPSFYNILGKELGFKPIEAGYEHKLKMGVSLPTTFLKEVKMKTINPELDIMKAYSKGKRRKIII